MTRSLLFSTLCGHAMQKSILIFFATAILIFFYSEKVVATNFGGTFNADTTLSLANSPYIMTGDAVISAGVVFSIEPGVEIEIPNLTYDLIIHGQLLANGTALDSIRFFSLATSGGGSIFVSGTSLNSTFAFCIFDKLGTNGSSAYDCGLRLEAEAMVSNCSFRNNTNDVIALPGVVGGFQNTNSLTDIDLVSGSFNFPATWPDADSSGFYYSLTGDIIVQASSTLSIEANVEIQIPNLTFDLLVSGSVLANGTSTQPVRFLGVGGASGGSVAILTGSTNSVFNYTIFENLGVNGSSAYDCGLWLDAEAAVSNCTFLSNTNDVRGRADKMGGFANNNSLLEIDLLTNSLGTTATLPNADQNGFHYNLLGDLTVPASEILTIDPGVEIQFPNLAFDLLVNGTLISNGNSINPVRFLGVGAGFGGSVAILTGSTNSILNYSIIESLGVNGSSAFDCGLWMDAEAQVSNCTFLNNTNDVRGRADKMGGFSNNNNLLDIDLLTNSLGESATLPNADQNGFYYELLGDLTVPASEILTIDPGVEIQFPNLAFDLLVNGTLISNGNSIDPVRFLGVGAGFGGSVAILTGSTNSVLNYSIFESLGVNGGSAFDCGLWLDAEALVSNCTFLNNINDVRGRADQMGGFSNNNSLLDIDLLTNSLGESATLPNADQNGFHYELLGDLTVPTSVILTIDPGVEIQFTNLGFDLLVNGTLISNGSSIDPVRFLGVGTGFGGSVAILTGSVNSVLNYSIFEFLGVNGGSAFDCGLWLDEEAQVSNCTFLNNTNDVRGRADKMGGFSNNNDLLDIDLLTNSLDTSATLPDADATGFYYDLLGDITVASGDTLTINPGVEVHSSQLSFDLLVNGTIIAEGTPSEYIQLSGVGPNDGGSIALLGTQKGSSFNYVKFDSLGVNSTSAFDAALYLESEAKVSNCIFANNTNDVRARATAVAGFQNSNTLVDIDIFTNSLDTTAIWPDADENGFYYYLLGDQTLGNGDTLSIHPNVEVQFPGLFIDFLINGTLMALGLPTQPVFFNGVTGSFGGSIAFLGGSSGSVLDFCRFENLGVNSSSIYDCAIWLEEEVQVSNCLFANNTKDVRARADKVGGFQNSNSLTDINLLANSLSQTSIWPNADSTGFFYNLESDLTLSSADSLTIAPGVEIDFPLLSTDMFIDGTIVAEGSEDRQIRFFSSGGSGGGSLVLRSSSTGSFLRYVIIDGLGINASSLYDSGVVIFSPDVQLTRSSILNSINGIRVDYIIPTGFSQVTAPEIKRNLIENNLVGIQVLQGDPLVRYNRIQNNTNFGLTNNLANVQVDACQNWWGDPSGPFNAAANPGGLGNAVTDNVLFDGCWLTQPPDVFLSVEFFSFDARAIGMEVILDWSTATENGNDFFEIERSRDGLSFTPIGMLDGQGSSTDIHNYQFLDKDPFSGLNYYRLRIVDLDGFYHYSPIRSVRISGLNTGEILVYPNPFESSLNIRFAEELNSNSVIKLSNSSGQLIFEDYFYQGERLKSIMQLESLPPGIYFLSISHGGNNLNTKLIKL